MNRISFSLTARDVDMTMCDDDMHDKDGSEVVDTSQSTSYGGIGKKDLRITDN